MPRTVESRNMVLLPVLDWINSGRVLWKWCPLLEGAFQLWAFLIPLLCFLLAHVGRIHPSLRLPGLLWCAGIPHPPFLSNCLEVLCTFSDLFRYSVREILYSHFTDGGMDVRVGAQSPSVYVSKVGSGACARQCWSVRTDRECNHCPLGVHGSGWGG